MTKIRTNPGAVCGSDHVSVVIDLRIRLKALKRQKIVHRKDMRVLKQDTTREQ